jgi:hypothetical protein
MAKSRPELFRLFANTFWGDYGDILISGIWDGIDEQSGVRRLIRTGPFVPPLTSPLRDIVVASELRSAMEDRFSDLSFEPVGLVKVVDIPWHTWDRTRDPEEWQLPIGHEPESYLSAPHSPELAKSIGPLWYVVLPEGAKSEFGSKPSPVKPAVLRLQISTWSGHDLFFTKPGLLPIVVVSRRGREWFEEHVPEWVHFEPAEAIE